MTRVPNSPAPGSTVDAGPHIIEELRADEFASTIMLIVGEYCSDRPAAYYALKKAALASGATISTRK